MHTKNWLDRLFDRRLVQPYISYFCKALGDEDEPNIIDTDTNKTVSWRQYVHAKPLYEKLWMLIKYTYWSTIPYWWRPGGMWYKFKCWGWKRYSTIKPRTVGHTWIDKGDLIPLLVFEAFLQFIEKEIDPKDYDTGIVDWHHDEEIQRIYEDIRAIQHWWTYKYLRHVKRGKNLPDSQGAYNIWVEQDECIQKEMTTMCKRILDIREYL